MMTYQPSVRSIIAFPATMPVSRAIRLEPFTGDDVSDGRVDTGVGHRALACENCEERAPRLRVSDVFLALVRCRAAS